MRINQNSQDYGDVSARAQQGRLKLSHIEMKLKQNSFETVWNCFISVFIAVRGPFNKMHIRQG